MIILVRYGEIHLKGQNRPYFERLLLKAIKSAVKEYDGAEVSRGEGRYYVSGFDDSEVNHVVESLKRVFGIHSMSIAYEAPKDMESIESLVLNVAKQHREETGLKDCTFKVECKRSDKRFPMNSMQLAAHLGGVLLDNMEGLKVDLHDPDMRVYCEVRDKAYCYCGIIPGQGGMPVGSSGRAVLLLSGGIDSPVAGYMTAKRGVSLEAVYFESPPYTSEAAKQKVIKLAGIVGRYAGPITLNVVPFTDIQMEIYQKCPHEALITIMRRFMMRIAERIARENDARAIVTGDSIAQVASQTLDSMYVAGSVVTLPVIRPLACMDKIEIIKISEAIGAYETSILPYEDCCTVFVPKHPLIHPKLEKIVDFEKKLDVDALVEKAMAGITREICI